MIKKHTGLFDDQLLLPEELNEFNVLADPSKGYFFFGTSIEQKKK